MSVQKHKEIYMLKELESITCLYQHNTGENRYESNCKANLLTTYWITICLQDISFTEETRKKSKHACTDNTLME